MKKCLLYLFIVLLLIYNASFSQTDIRIIENYRYAKFNKTWYTVTKDNERGDRVDTSHVIVRLKNDGFLTDFNFSKIDLPRLKDVRGRFAGSFYELEIPKNADPFEVTKKLSDSGLFDVVHLNLYGKIASIYPNDPYYVAGSHWNLGRIKMPEAWDKSTGSSTIKVAVIDNGVEHDHPDLIKNSWSGIGYDFLDMDFDPKPENIGNVKNCHGTCTVGIICANLNNSLGVSGIAGGWGTQKGVTFMSLRAGINDEMDKIYSAVNDSKLVSTFRIYEFTGLRLSELFHSRLEGDFIKVEQSKGRKERIIPIPTELIQDYLIATDKPYSMGFISRSFHLACQKSGLSGKTIHSLRHTFALRKLLETNNLQLVKELLGHSSVKVTEIYTTFPPDFLAQVLKQRSINGSNFRPSIQA